MFCAVCVPEPLSAGSEPVSSASGVPFASAVVPVPLALEPPAPAVLVPVEPAWDVDPVVLPKVGATGVDAAVVEGGVVTVPPFDTDVIPVELPAATAAVPLPLVGASAELRLVWPRTIVSDTQEEEPCGLSKVWIICTFEGGLFASGVKVPPAQF